MRSVVLLVACTSGCNDLYGLDKTRLPPPDAPPRCPPINGGAPTFSKDVFQAVTQPVDSYQFNATGTLAVGLTYDGVYTGRLGDRLELEPSIVLEPEHVYSSLRVSPDGNRIYMHQYFQLVAATGNGIGVYERAGGGWRFVEFLPPEVDGVPSTIFRGPSGDRVIINLGATYQEYERENGEWVTRGPARDRSALGIDGSMLAVTSDGLRAVYFGNTDQQMYYTDRLDLMSWFRAPQPLAGVPKVAELQMTDDCARIYYTGLGSAFYSQQL